MSFRVRCVERHLHPAHIFGSRSGHGHHIRIVAVGTHQQDAGRVEASAACGSFAYQLIEFGAGLRPHDRFIGGAQRREHPRQPFLLLVGARLFVGAVEISEREGDVLAQPLQHLDQFGRERPPLRRIEDHDAVNPGAVHDHAPRADEILLALVMTTGPRIHARVGGLKASEIKGEDGLR